jgi:murein DD-endopeptidase MepM/ murein hydrolase activator NlpD
MTDARYVAKRRYGRRGKWNPELDPWNANGEPWPVHRPRIKKSTLPRRKLRAMASFRLSYPITEPENFLRETFMAAEWSRPTKPDGSPYRSYNVYTGTRAHWGIDLQDHGYGDRIYAGVNGVAYRAYFSSALGIHVIVRDDATGLWLLFCHLNRAYITNGQRVRADQVIGLMGTTGGVPKHLHFSLLTRNTYGYFTSPVTALNAMKGELMALADDVANKVYAKIRSDLDYLYGAVSVSGANTRFSKAGAASVRQVLDAVNGLDVPRRASARRKPSGKATRKPAKRRRAA